jgi:prepilin-type processing-associated H-X9-DG protein
MDDIGHSNYAAVHHDFEAPINVNNNGVFFLNSRISQDDVKDGMRYTFFLGEKILVGGDLGWMSGTRATLRNTGSPINTTDSAARGTRGLSLMLTDGDALDSEEGDTAEQDVSEEDEPAAEQASNDEPVTPDSNSKPPQDEVGELPIDQAPLQEAEIEKTEIENAEIEEAEIENADKEASDQPLSPPDTDVEKAKDASEQDPWAAAKQAGLYVGGFGSFHKGGSVFAFGDGHVRFVDNGIDFKVYRHMGGRADGQVIDARALR